jgi:hypothetical protein
MSRNTKIWLYGLIAALVGGFGTFLAGLMVDIDPHKLWKLCLFTTLTAVGAYLKQHPVPEIQQLELPLTKTANP